MAMLSASPATKATAMLFGESNERPRRDLPKILLSHETFGLAGELEGRQRRSGFFGEYPPGRVEAGLSWA